MLKPLNDRVLVEPLHEDEITQAGIILPDTAEKEKAEKGKVIAAGPGRLLENGQRAPMSVKVGDVIIFKKYSPDEVKEGKKEYLMLSEADILAIIQ